MNQYKKEKYEIGDVIGEITSDSLDAYPNNLLLYDQKSFYFDNSEELVRNMCNGVYQDKQVKVIGYSTMSPTGVYIGKEFIVAAYSFNNMMFGIFYLGKVKS